MTECRIALAIRVRNEWQLVRGLLEQLRPILDEAWVLDDASDVPVGPQLDGIVPRLIHVRALQWSGSGGKLGEGLQRDYLLQRIKRESRCDWVLQLDADERIPNVDALARLATTADVDGWVLPLVDFYITPGDAEFVNPRDPSMVREWFGVETRWTMALFRPRRPVYVSRGDVREPQGLRVRRVRESGQCVIEHFGKAISVAEWERKVDFYSQHYPEYREKWLARRGAAVHNGVSDFGSALQRRGDPSFDPTRAPVIHRYRARNDVRSRAKQLVYGVVGPSRWLVATETRVITP